MKYDTDFDVRVFNYLKDKFPEHKLSDYEEASAWLTHCVLIEVNKWVEYQMKRSVKRY